MSEDRIEELHANLRRLSGELSAQQDHNARLMSTLREAREQIVVLKEEVDRLAVPPNGFGTFLQAPSRAPCRPGRRSGGGAQRGNEYRRRGRLRGHR